MVEAARRVLKSCITCRIRGCLLATTPYASLAHVVPPSRICSADAEQEAKLIKGLWGNRLTRDPYYNPNLNRDSPDYEPDLSANCRTTMSSRD